VTKGRWIEIAAFVDNEAVEAVSEAFQRYAHGGVVIEYPTEPGAEIAWNEPAVIDRTRPIAVRGYLPSGRDGKRRQRQIEEAVWHLARIWPIEGPTVREVQEEDWANAWKEHFHAHRVGERLVIKPTWREFEAEPGDLLISLDPGMAFGTGLHPTTQLCLRALERLVEPNDRVLDVGTGSGILAVAAARLGASSVFAVDLDGIAIEAAWSNVDANGLRDLVHVRHGDAADLPEAGTFDVVVANIIARVIQASAASLARQLRPGGRLIASGVLVERRDDVAASLEAAGVAVFETPTDGDWCAIVGTRR
jgi:ribosomal protein L11 methyltransferase